jgi:hypothetical protein
MSVKIENLNEKFANMIKMMYLCSIVVNKNQITQKKYEDIPY